MTRKATRSAPIQFRLPIGDYEILQRLADRAEISPKDYVIALTNAAITRQKERSDAPDSQTA